MMISDHMTVNFFFLQSVLELLFYQTRVNEDDVLLYLVFSWLFVNILFLNSSREIGDC